MIPRVRLLFVKVQATNQDKCADGMVRDKKMNLVLRKNKLKKSSEVFFSVLVLYYCTVPYRTVL